MEHPTREFMESLIGKRVAVSTTNSLIFHGVLLYVEEHGIVVGIGKFKNPRPVLNEYIAKMFALNDDRETPAVGTVLGGKKK